MSETDQIRPPQVIDVLADICQHARRKPVMFPSDPRAAASYWINHQEPPNESTERPRQIKQKDKVFWQTPYHDRLAANLRTFLQFKKIHQLFVIEAIERGIPWRGDSVEFFADIIRETDKMLANKDEYIENGLQTLKDFKIGKPI